MKTTMTQLAQSWKSGDLETVRAILKRTSKIAAMNFAVLIALTEGGESAARLLRLMAGYES
jgi:hypothetical protein